MSKFQRLSKAERQAQIQEAAKKIFLKKGFQKTTMEDIIAETGMSKGGVYHYYKSTIDILYDLMMAGNQYRLQMIPDHLSNLEPEKLKELAIELIIDKMLDHNEFKSIYVMFLMESQNNISLKKLYEKLETQGIEFMKKYMKKNQIKGLEVFASKPFIALVNSIIIGCEVLDAREDFTKNREFFREILKAILEGEKNND